MNTSTCPQCTTILTDGSDEVCPRCLLSGFLLHESEGEPLEGVRFGEYELRERVASGGMGVVYQAWHPGLHRLVALKMLKSGRLADAAERQRFAVEAEAVAQLDHPGIVPIYEVGEHEEQPFYTMRLVEGGRSGVELSRAQPVDFRRVATTLVEVARAVHFAHQRGILHRDLKPANILLDAEGRAFIVDFGLAKFTNADTGLTVSGAVLGTPAYMAPEVAGGGSRAATVAADVYSLGTLLYEWTTGRPPFAAETTLEMLRKIAQEEPPPPSTLNAQLSRDLETICLKCLQKQPDKRYASAAALADDLDRWLRGEPITARPVATWERLARWCRRRPAMAALIAVSVLAATAFILREQAANRRLTEEKDAAQQQTVLARAAEREARQSAYFYRIFVASEARKAGTWTLARRLLQQPDPDGFRGLEWKLLSAACLENDPLHTVQANGPVTSLAISPDHAHFFAVDRTGVHAWSLSDKVPHDELLPPDKDLLAACTQVICAPDGKWIALATARRGISTFTWPEWKPLTVLHGDNAGMAVSGDGSRLLIRSGGTGILYNTLTWQPVARTAPCGEPFALNHDGSLLAHTLPGEDGRIEDTATEEVLCHFDGGHGAMAFNEEGSVIASSGTNGRVLAHQADTGKWEIRAEDVGEALGAVAWIGGQPGFAAGGSNHVIKMYGVTAAGSINSDRRMVDSHHHAAEISSMAWNHPAGPAGPALLLSGSRDGQIIYHDILHSEAPKRMDEKLIAPLLVFPGSPLFVGTRAGGECVLCDAAARTIIKEFPPPPHGQPLGQYQHDASVLFLQIPPGGSTVSLTRVHARTGEAAPPVPLSTTETDRSKYTASLNPARIAILETPRRISVWDGDTGASLGTIEADPEVTALQLSPNGDILYQLSAGSWSARSLAGGHPLWSARFPGAAPHKFFFDGSVTVLAAAKDDGTIDLFSCRDGQQFRHLTGHGTAVVSCAFTPDSTRLITTAGFADVKVWELYGGSETASLLNLSGIVKTVAITGDGQHLLRSNTGGGTKVLP